MYNIPNVTVTTADLAAALAAPVSPELTGLFDELMRKSGKAGPGAR